MSEWISVDKFLPGENSDWVIVITKNKDHSIFLFMADYDHSTGEWNYFDEDEDYETSMKVIFWHPLPASFKDF